ncbi:ATP-dependent RNA helicase DDX54/DBP10 [Nematocida sp. LUAm3]|nr:ATP-dependent RNA helicase DDX54/DBP10 [Nematocida sp. LUAm3]KAI5175514.1 ATP-dependent RNA helicase DDX54/DBP10 [Nematocida sp. LUAm2]KAI5178456.1 ATP-dependent RNA helicase DDX54/DBP10 [Nematocida sp. LUAm1]
MDFGISVETQQKESVTFKGMGIPKEILGNIQYPIATPIQRKVIPRLNMGEDIITVSRTGSGKTYAYVIPILMQLLKEREKKTIYTKAKAIVIVPTYELAMQVASVFRDLSKNGVHPALFTGMGSLAHSFNYLVVGEFEVAICTPGRLEHMIVELSSAEKNKPIYVKVDDKGTKREMCIEDSQLLQKITHPDIVVIDEMDRIFEDNALSLSLERILGAIQGSPQYALFSATHHRGNIHIRTLLNRKDMALVEILGGVSDHLESGRLIINNLHVQEDIKFSLLLSLLKKHSTKKILIFVSTCKRAMVISTLIKEQGYRAGVFSSMESEEAREEVMKAFKNDEISILVSTDVGCRGLDIKGIKAIIEYDYAPNRNTSVHRVGRMNRGRGEDGVLFSFIRSADLPTYFAFLNHIYSEKPRDATRPTRLCFQTESCIFNSEHKQCVYLGLGAVPSSIYINNHVPMKRLLEIDNSFSLSYDKYCKTNPVEKIDNNWVLSSLCTKVLPVHKFFGISSSSLLTAVRQYKSKYNPITSSITYQQKPQEKKKKQQIPVNLEKYRDPNFISYENIKSSTYTPIENKPNREKEIQERIKKMSKSPGTIFTEWKKSNRDRLNKGYLLKRPTAEEAEEDKKEKYKKSEGETRSVRKISEVRERREKDHQERRLKVQKKRKSMKKSN